MNTLNPADLRELIKVCRELGINHLKHADIEISLNPQEQTHEQPEPDPEPEADDEHDDENFAAATGIIIKRRSKSPLLD